MGYTGLAFSAGEVPTTAIWNTLWQNDASFNNGTGIGNGVVQYVNLLSTIFSGQIVTGSQAGTLGGTTNYVNIGGFIIQWGISVQRTNGTTGGQEGCTFPLTFPNAITYYCATMVAPGANANQTAYFNAIPSTSTGVIAINNWSANGSATAYAMWLVMGT